MNAMDDELRDALVGTSAEAKRSVRPQGTTAPESDQQTREAMQPRDLDAAPPESDDEIIRRPYAAGPRARQAVVVLSATVVGILLLLTLFVIVTNGPTAMAVITLVVLSFISYALINAATYQGEDPLEKLREMDDERTLRDDARRAERHAAVEARRAAKRARDAS